VNVNSNTLCMASCKSSAPGGIIGQGARAESKTCRCWDDVGAGGAGMTGYVSYIGRVVDKIELPEKAATIVRLVGS